MAWKLVGTSAGTPVTLLRCVDRKEAEVQMARLETEGYYQHLQIYPVDDRVPLSSVLIRARKLAIDNAKDEVGARRVATAPFKRPKEPKAAANANRRSKSGSSRAARSSVPKKKQVKTKRTTTQTKRTPRSSKAKRATSKAVKSAANSSPKPSKKKSKVAKAKKSIRKRK